MQLHVDYHIPAIVAGFKFDFITSNYNVRQTYLYRGEFFATLFFLMESFCYIFPCGGLFFHVGGLFILMGCFF